MKVFLEDLLCRVPGLYSRLLRFKPGSGVEKRIFLRLLSRGEVVVEGGANRGYFTELFSRVVGPQGQVHAFEPIPETFERLTRQLSPCGFFQLILNQKGLGDACGRVVFSLPGNDDGQASMRAHHQGSWIGPAKISQFDCEITTLDAYAVEQGFSRLDFIKLDVEGAEHLVVRGAVQTLQQFKPLLFLEVFGNWLKDFGSTPDDLTKTLWEIGYRHFWIVEDQVREVPDVVKGGAGMVKVGGQSLNLLASFPDVRGTRLRRDLAGPI